MEGIMATIRDLLSNRTIHYVQPDQTVFEAAHYMVECNVGAVPVLDGTQLVGIFSERDLMRRVVTEGARSAVHVYCRSDEHRSAHGRSQHQLRRSHVPDADPQHSASAGMRRLHARRLSLVARSVALPPRRKIHGSRLDARLHPDVLELAH